MAFWVNEPDPFFLSSSATSECSNFFKAAGYATDQVQRARKEIVLNTLLKNPPLDAGTGT
ncbi:MAG: hypothetical protein ACK4GT_18150 [Pararhodobacter sp.]